jgi:ubiquinol-cytochrome c reductase cytochrome c subunit
MKNLGAQRIRACSIGLAGFALMTSVGLSSISEELSLGSRSQATPSIDPDELRSVLVQNCLICHSEELISGQRLTEKQWTAEVEKMIGWGAPLPPEFKTPLIGYLFSLYSDKTPKTAPPTLGVEEALALDRIDPMGSPALYSGGDVDRGAALYAEHCSKCHGTEARGGDLGQSLVERPILYREAEFAEILRKGRNRMPGFSVILDNSCESDLVAWLRSKR